MRVHYRGKLFDPNFGFNDSRIADVYGYIKAKGKVTKKVGDEKFSIGPWFTIYFNDGSEFEVKNITQISEADVVVEGIIAFIRAYKGQASVILRTDSRKAFEHLATPIVSLKEWKLKVDRSLREEFEKYHHLVGIAYEYPSVVSKTVKVYRMKAKSEKE